MTDSEFESHLSSIIKHQHYVNLTKEVEKEYAHLSSGDKVFQKRKFGYLLLGTGNYEKQELQDGWVIYKSSNYYLNERNKRISNTTIFIAGAAVFISLISLIKDFSKSDIVQVKLPQEISTEFQIQSQKLEMIELYLDKLNRSINDTVLVRSVKP